MPPSPRCTHAVVVIYPSVRLGRRTGLMTCRLWLMMRGTTALRLTDSHRRGAFTDSCAFVILAHGHPCLRSTLARRRAPKTRQPAARPDHPVTPTRSWRPSASARNAAETNSARRLVTTTTETGIRRPGIAHQERLTTSRTAVTGPSALGIPTAGGSKRNKGMSCFAARELTQLLAWASDDPRPVRHRVPQ